MSVTDHITIGLDHSEEEDVDLHLDELKDRVLLGGLYCGEKKNLERAANALLREGRRGVTALSEKKDYLTDEQMALRQAREVLNGNGYPDPSIKQGLYRRAYSASFGSRPGRMINGDDG